MMGKSQESIDKQIMANMKVSDAKMIANDFADEFDKHLLATLHVCEEKVCQTENKVVISNSFY